MVNVRFAPSPTGSLHLGNALSAVANRRFADERQGRLLLRIDDTDPTRNVEGGFEAIVADLEWLGIAWDEGPLRQSERHVRHREAAHLVGEPDAEGALRFGRATLLRPDGSPTYQLATAVDDLDFEITHVLRGSDHRANIELQSALIRGLGGEPPEYIHHGLLLGLDGRKLSKRHGASSLVDLREQGFPAEAVRAYLEELGLPRHDVHLDLARVRRLSTETLAGLSDEELARRVGVPVSVAPVLRGARDLAEAREYAAQVLEPAEAEVNSPETLARLRELVEAGLEPRAIVRELKAVGGDLKAVRLALTGRDRGPELAAVIAALSRDELLSRLERGGSTTRSRGSSRSCRSRPGRSGCTSAAPRSTSVRISATRGPSCSACGFEPGSASADTTRPSSTTSPTSTTRSTTPHPAPARSSQCARRSGISRTPVISALACRTSSRRRRRRSLRSSVSSSSSWTPATRTPWRAMFTSVSRAIPDTAASRASVPTRWRSRSRIR